MNPLLHWLTSPEWTHIVGALLHSLWQGAIIALALAVLMRRLANPVTRYRCALVTLGLVVIAGIVTWAVLNAPKSAVSIAITIPVTEPAITPAATTALNPDSADKIVALGRMSPPPAPKYWIAWLAVVWMLGTIAMLLRAGIKVAGAENLRRSCQPLNDERMVALVAEARRAVGLVRQIRVAVTDKLTSPAVVGVLVPTLILPLSLFTALTPEQIRFVLLHELAHIRRGDYFANLFQLLAEALLFFNPAVWWISHQIRREREASCDALAIELSGAPADYALTLVRVAENILQPATNAAVAFGDGQREPSSLADRVQRLLVPGYRPALRLTWRAMLASLVVGGTLLVLSAVGTRSTVGAILSSNRSSTNDPVIPLNDPRSVTKTGKIENSSDEISNDYSLNYSDYSVTNLWPMLPLPMFRVRTDALPLISIFTNRPSNSIRKSFRNDNTTAPVLATLTGILTDPQFRELVKAINQRSAINSTSEDLVTQLSDRRAQVLISAVDKNNIATEIENLPARRGAAETTPDDIINQANPTSVQPTASPNSSDSIQSQVAPFVSQSTADSGTLLPNARASSSAVDLSTRTFMVGPVELAHALARSGPVQATNAAAMVHELMVKAGVDLEPPKTVVFKDSLGLLMVRATKAELDTIEKFLVQANQGAASGTLPSGPTGEPKAMIPIPMKTPATAGSGGSTNLHLRVFAVDAQALVQMLARQHGTNADLHAKPITDGSLLLPEIRKLFASVGVDLERPKTLFFNEPRGQLLVRATQTDLDTIEQVLEVLNDQPPQINIKVKFVAIPPPLVGPMLQEFLTNALYPSLSRTQSLSSLLTEKQMAEVRKHIDAGDGMTLLSEGDVTTLSGRQCQIQTVEMNTIVTGIYAKALTRPGVIATNDTGSAFLETELTPFGPILDATPTVSRDQANITLRVIATLTEFLGYGKTKSVPVYVNGKKKTTTLPLPKYRLQQMTNDCVILDGQTLMLGNLPTTEIAKQPNGEFLATDVSGSKTNSLFVFITPTLIDPAGNRVNPVRKSPSF